MATINKVLSVIFYQKIDSWKAPSLNYRTGMFYSSINRAVKEEMRAKLEGEGIERLNSSKPIILSFCFVFKMPQRWKRAKCYPGKRDVTNCQKLFEDALKGYIYEDDRQVVAITDFKIWGEKEHIIIEAFEIDDQDTVFHVDCPTVLNGMMMAIDSLRERVTGRTDIIFDGYACPKRCSLKEDIEYNSTDNGHNA